MYLATAHDWTDFWMSATAVSLRNPKQTGGREKLINTHNVIIRMLHSAMHVQKLWGRDNGSIWTDMRPRAVYYNVKILAVHDKWETFGKTHQNYQKRQRTFTECCAGLLIELKTFCYWSWSKVYTLKCRARDNVETETNPCYQPYVGNSS